MKDRRNVLSIVRWKHRQQSFDLSWPLLHFVSFFARAMIICVLVCPPLGLALIAYGQDMSLGEVTTRLTTIKPPAWLLVVIVVPFVIAFLDFVLRNRLRITPLEVEFRRPWGTKRIWSRSSLVGVQCDFHQIETSSSGTTKMGHVQLILSNHQDRERLDIGGSLYHGIARELTKEVGHYTRVRSM